MVDVKPSALELLSKKDRSYHVIQDQRAASDPSFRRMSKGDVARMLQPSEQFNLTFQAGAYRKTPYSEIIIKDEVEGWDFAVGKVEEVNERVALDTRYRWNVTAMIHLSDLYRLRMVTILLHPPENDLVEAKGFRDSRVHADNMKARNQKRSPVVRRMVALFEDRDWLLHHCPMRWPDEFTAAKTSDRLGAMITFDGLFRAIEAFCIEPVPEGRFGAPVNNPFIKVMLDNSLTVAMGYSTFQQDTPREYLRLWLKDCCEAFPPSKRWHQWDPVEQMYVEYSQDSWREYNEARKAAGAM